MGSEPIQPRSDVPMPSFAVSIATLSLLQAALVALPRPWRFDWLERFRNPWWALVPALSIVVVIGIVALENESATALSWLALVAVPPFAALALGWLVRGARPGWALAVVPFFALAWASPGSLAGETAATALTALGCVGLGWLLVAVAPASWLKLGIYAMAIVDTWFVASDLLQGPNAVLTAAAPSGLPRLQAIHFGSALMGFGDLFIAAILGCLLAAERTRQVRAALLVAVLALAFDLLFLAVDTLPATVPVALALALIELRGRRAPTPRSSRSPRQRQRAGPRA
ncbi:MAG TPA: hypothetical protein VLK89_06075 [Solirubrobacterales bacterium]|nr:hypothetical protein [Solirubrobacterales bacterium]